MLYAIYSINVLCDVASLWAYLCRFHVLISWILSWDVPMQERTPVAFLWRPCGVGPDGQVVLVKGPYSQLDITRCDDSM